MAKANQSKLGSLREHLIRRFRVSIIEEKSLEQIKNFRFTNGYAYLILSLGVIGIMGFTFCTIAFTPLKKIIPGYGDVNSNEVVHNLNKEIEFLELELKSQNTVISSIKRVITGNLETEEQAKENAQLIPDSSIVSPLYVDSSEAGEELVDDDLNVLDLERDDQVVKMAELEGIDFFPPVNGTVSAGFMTPNDHLGVDILAAKNTAIKAALDGIVISSDWTLETGNTISLQHKNNIITSYKHNSVLLKKVGTSVKAGEAIAIIGNTGTLTTGPHLHFELWVNGKPINPVDYIKF